VLVLRSIFFALLLPRTVTLLLYTGVWFLIVNLFVMSYEEPTLRGRFGESYEQYRRSVGRWIPRRVK
jgi:protein-S-isoprenylcysteine O-methyltransferase Ste14